MTFLLVPGDEENGRPEGWARTSGDRAVLGAAGSSEGPQPTSGKPTSGKGSDRTQAASRRVAQHGSRPPTEVGAVVREGGIQCGTRGHVRPARTLSTIPAAAAGTPSA